MEFSFQEKQIPVLKVRVKGLKAVKTGIFDIAKEECLLTNT